MGIDDSWAVVQPRVFGGRMSMLPVTFLTDFGSEDDFAGVCHGVVLTRAPDAHVVHVTHGIDPHDVVQGAIMLRNSIPFLPVGIHVGVVDPGVGTERRAVVIESADGRRFVGPDNGLLVPAAESCGGIVRAHSIESPGVMLDPVSSTFHGRDVFAPTAGFLSAGGGIDAVGPSIPVDSLVRVRLPELNVIDGVLTGVIWHIDRFGNAAFGIDSSALTEFVGGADEVEVAIRGDRYFATVARTFGMVGPGDLLIFADAYDCVSLAVNHGNAAEMFVLSVGNTLGITAR
jgi:S-adenosylmethionine hydrolase